MASRALIPHKRRSIYRFLLQLLASLFLENGQTDRRAKNPGHQLRQVQLREREFSFSAVSLCP
jgi:hypothetical protein